LAHGALARISHARARRVARDVLVGLGFGPSPAIKVVAVAWLVADFLYRADTGKVHEEAALQLVTDIVESFQSRIILVLFGQSAGLID
jgi:hypothetical protein